MSTEIIDSPVKSTNEEKEAVKPPKMFDVFLLNDDYTTPDVVLETLDKVFDLTGSKAMRVMMKAHMEGMSFVAKYVKDIAESKVANAESISSAKGFPLRYEAKPED